MKIFNTENRCDRCLQTFRHPDFGCLNCWGNPDDDCDTLMKIATAQAESIKEIMDALDDNHVTKIEITDDISKGENNE